MQPTFILYLLSIFVCLLAAPTPIKRSDDALAITGLASPEETLREPIRRYLTCPAVNVHDASLAYIDARPVSRDPESDVPIMCAYEDSSSCTYSMQTGALTASTNARSCIPLLKCLSCGDTDEQAVQEPEVEVLAKRKLIRQETIASTLEEEHKEFTPPSLEQVDS